MPETNIKPTNVKPPTISQGMVMLELEPTQIGAIRAERCADPTQGLNLEIADGRVTVRLTLDEAIKLSFFIQAVVEAANRQVKQKHDEIMKCPLPSQGPQGVGLERSMEFLTTLPGAPPSEEGSEPKGPFLKQDD